MDLCALGAGPEIAGAFQPYAAQGMILARVAISQRDRYRLITESGDLEGEPSGGLWYRTPDRAGMPVTGDWVAARNAGGCQAIVEAVLPRRTLFSRRAAGNREDEQAIAANIDLLFLVCGLDGDFNLRRLERYLTLAMESGAGPVVVLNKADLCPDVGARIAETQAVANHAPVMACSARDGGSLAQLTGFLGYGRTVALLGSSGVGKSTLVNRILGEERLLTREVRESDSRGRHTTTHRELIPLPQGGALIDTPGMRELQLWAGEESVVQTFEEIGELATGCRYRDCSHAGEPGCAVAEALSGGRLDACRWESYRKLIAEARRHERMSDPLAALEHKRRWKVIHKAAREIYKRKGRE